MNPEQIDREEDRRVAQLRASAKNNRPTIRPSNADFGKSRRLFRRSGVKFGLKTNGPRVLGIYDPAVAAEMVIRQIKAQSAAQEYHRQNVGRVLMKDGIWQVPPDQRPKIANGGA